MPVDREFQLETEIERLKTQVKSLTNLLYESCEMAYAGSFSLQGRVRAWWHENREKVRAQIEEDNRRDEAERLRDEREYQRLKDKLGL